jgi:hypothetical protein
MTATWLVVNKATGKQNGGVEPNLAIAKWNAEHAILDGTLGPADQLEARAVSERTECEYVLKPSRRAWRRVTIDDEAL